MGNTVEKEECAHRLRLYQMVLSNINMRHHTPVLLTDHVFLAAMKKIMLVINLVIAFEVNVILNLPIIGISIIHFPKGIDKLVCPLFVLGNLNKFHIYASSYRSQVRDICTT